MSSTRNLKPETRNPVIEVAAGLIFRDGKLLITQRHADSHLGGLWEFPGGKREEGETYAQCLQRELREELGCEVVVGERMQAVSHEYPEKRVHIEFFHCRWVAHEPRAIGCADLRWVTQSELEHFSFPAADEQLLVVLKQRAELWR